MHPIKRKPYPPGSIVRICECGCHHLHEGRYAIVEVMLGAEEVVLRVNTAYGTFVRLTYPTWQVTKIGKKSVVDRVLDEYNITVYRGKKGDSPETSEGGRDVL